MHLAAPGDNMTFGRYVTSDAIRLGTFGLVAGMAVGFAWRTAGRLRWGVAPFMMTVVIAAALSGRSDWPHWSGMVGAGAIVTLFAGVGAGRLLANPAIHWSWVGAGALISVAGVWAAVPETGPALVVGGGLVGLSAAAGLTRAHWSPAAGAGAATVLGWAALSGSAGYPWAALGGALCTGVAPWFALSRMLPTTAASWCPRRWVFGAHVALVVIAARWIGVDPHAQWGRVAVVAFAGIVVSVTSQRQA